MERIIIKVSCIGENWGYWEIKDVTNIFNDITKEDGIKAAEEYFKEGTWNDSDTSGYTAGFLEGIGQSDYCPPKIYTENFKVVVERVKE